MLRKFDSGVMVIQNKAHSDEEVWFRVLGVFFANPVIFLILGMAMHA